MALKKTLYKPIQSLKSIILLLCCFTFPELSPDHKPDFAGDDSVIYRKYFIFSSSVMTHSIKSPGWQRNMIQILLRVSSVIDFPDLIFWIVWEGKRLPCLIYVAVYPFSFSAFTISILYLIILVPFLPSLFPELFSWFNSNSIFWPCKEFHFLYFQSLFHLCNVSNFRPFIFIFFSLLFEHILLAIFSNIW